MSNSYLDYKIDIPKELRETFIKKPAQKFRDNQMVYTQGEIAESFYYLKKGRVEVFVSSPDGVEKVLAIYEGGSIFGEASFFDGLPRMSSAKALSNSEIVGINKADILMSFQKEPFLGWSFIELLSKKVRMLSNQIDDISFLSAEKRIAQYLINRDLHDNAAIYYTHEDIAKTVGVSRVTVSRALNKFSQNKWIETKYKKILILDSDCLQEFLKE